MKLNDLFPSRFLKAEDLKGRDVKLHIKGVSVEDLGGERKAVMEFLSTEKQMVLNKTNASTIAAMFGDDLDGWAGNEITLYPDKVAFQGKLVDAIRVRYIASQPATTAAIEQTAQPTEAPAGGDDAESIPF